MPSTKRKASSSRRDSFIASSPSADENNNLLSSSKRSKPSTTTTTPFQPASSLTAPKTDDEGSTYFELSKARRVTISDFKGKKMVSIREYYEKDGKWLPGKKGISMTLEQYGVLMGLLPRIEEVLRECGEDVSRPVYGEGQGNGEGEGEGEGVQREGMGGDNDHNDVGEDRVGVREKSGAAGRRANIEETSDEEDG